MNLEQSESAEILRSFEVGRRLYHLVHSDGWNDLLDILEGEVIKAEFRLLNIPAGSSNELQRDLLSHARAARSIFEQTQLRVNSVIEQSKEEVMNGTVDDSLDYNTHNL